MMLPKREYPPADVTTPAPITQVDTAGVHPHATPPPPPPQPEPPPPPAPTTLAYTKVIPAGIVTEPDDVIV